jgi:hypothetical protein
VTPSTETLNLYIIHRQNRDLKMSEQKPERKVVGRTIAISLGIICIILAVGLVGAVADYTSILTGKDNDISALTNRNNQLQIWLNANKTLYNNYVANHHNTDSDYNSLATQNANLQDQYANLQSEYNQLMINYTEALAKIPADKGITIDGINYTGSTVTGIAVRNLGVNATTVKSLKLIWLNHNVLASSQSVNVVILGNSTAVITTHLPINGWDTVYDTWVVEVITLEGYNATSDPIMLAM